MAVPNRWLHVRHERGFSPEDFNRFQAGCALWRGYVETYLAQSFSLVGAPTYVFFEPQLSADRRTATLPLGGEPTVGSRAEFENLHSYLLQRFLPADFRCDVEEGLTEALSSESQPSTTWRRPTQLLEHLIREGSPFTSSR